MFSLTHVYTRTKNLFYFNNNKYIRIKLPQIIIWWCTCYGLVSEQLFSMYSTYLNNMNIGGGKKFKLNDQKNQEKPRKNTRVMIPGDD